MSALIDLAALVEHQSGMRMGANQMTSLVAALARLGHGDAAEVLRMANAEGRGSIILEQLVGEVTIKETSFLRDAAQLNTIRWRELLEDSRRAGSRRLRVWSAACATGEEPFTLALLASDALGDEGDAVEILGTDIAGAAVAHARRGRYHARALRHLDPAQVARHFSREDGEFAAAPHLREMVAFRQHNLARDAFPPGGGDPFDLILCRNVLIYFRPRVVERVMASFHSAQRPAGTILLGSADRLCVPRTTARAVSVVKVRKPKPASRGPQALDSPHARPRRRDLEARRRDPAGTAVPLAEAVRLADEGLLEEAAEAAYTVLRHDPMNAPAHYVSGTAELALGNGDAAVAALKRALYVDGAFALAAFQLGRAYDALEREPQARQAYGRALRTFDPDDGRHDWLLGQVDVGDLAAACRARIAPAAASASLAGASAPAPRRLSGRNSGP